MIRVFLADDHPLLRIGLRFSLEHRGEVELVGEADNGFAAVERIQAMRPDVALIDVDMPGLSGVGAIRILRQSLPQLKILVLSTYNDENYIREAMKAGADGYVLKNVDIDELVRIIYCVYYGKKAVSPYLVNLALAQQGRETDDGSLTIREKQVLEFITAGKSNKEIAEEMNISTETVKTHTRKIYQKLKVRNRVQAARHAMGSRGI